MTATKAISFSLWGDSPLYLLGAVRNVALAKRIYPEWMCFFYCNSCVPVQTIDALMGADNTAVRRIDSKGSNRSSMNRFLAVDEPGLTHVIFRDADSRISYRERIAVDAWLQAGTDVHVMRDHPYHSWYIQAGMFGVKPGKFIDHLVPAMNSFVGEQRTVDQDFMSAYICKRLSSGEITQTVHDPFHARIPFPTGCQRGEANGGVCFVGERIELGENNEDLYESEAYTNNRRLVRENDLHP